MHYIISLGQLLNLKTVIYTEGKKITDLWILLWKSLCYLDQSNVLTYQHLSPDKWGRISNSPSHRSKIHTWFHFFNCCYFGITLLCNWINWTKLIILSVWKTVPKLVLIYITGDPILLFKMFGNEKNERMLNFVVQFTP